MTPGDVLAVLLVVGVVVGIWLFEAHMDDGNQTLREAIDMPKAGAD